MKNKIILINPSSSECPPNYFGPPYGLSMIGASLLNDSREVLACDFEQTSPTQMIEQVTNMINYKKPEYIGITTQSSTRGSVYKLINAVKKINPRIQVIIGGPFASSKYNLILRHFPVDYVVLGEGERTIVELLDSLDKEQIPKKVHGLAFRIGKKVVVTKQRENEQNLDLLPTPAFHLFGNFENRINEKTPHRFPDFILRERTTLAKNSLLLLSSRGCYFSCNFCPMSSEINHTIRFHSPAFFSNTLEHFNKHLGINNFAFGDNFFTADRKRTIDICSAILNKNLKINWNCMTRSDFVDIELLNIMKRAGCYEIFYGVESGSSKIQRTIGKKLNFKKTLSGFKDTRKAGIRSVLMLMTGNTGETNKTIEESLTYAHQIKADKVLIKKTQIYPGTRIGNLSESRGFIKKSYYLNDSSAAPFFLARNSEKKFNQFHKQFWPKTISLQIGNTCNNRCKFCNIPRNRLNKSFSEIKNSLKLASVRSEYIELRGGEALLRKDFFDILEFAKKLNIYHVNLYSNCRVLACNYTAKKISETNLEKITIPFFGLPDYHDEICRVNHAFSQTLKGIENLLRHGAKINLEALIVLTTKNIPTAKILVEQLLRYGLNSCRFLFYSDSVGEISVPSKYLPKQNIIPEPLLELFKDLVHKKIKFSTEGLPLCAEKRFLDNAYDFHAPFDETINFKGDIIPKKRIQKRGKHKINKCFSCRLEKACDGLLRCR